MGPELEQVFGSEGEGGSDHEEALKDFGDVSEIEGVVGSVWGWKKFFGHF